MCPSLLSDLWGAMLLNPERELNCCLTTSTLATTDLHGPDLSSSRLAPTLNVLQMESMHDLRFLNCSS